MLLWIEATKVLDVPRVAHVHSILALQSVGSWDNYTAHDERALPWGSKIASGGLDPSEYQVADVEVALLDIFVMISTELLLGPGVLEGCR